MCLFSLFSSLYQGIKLMTNAWKPKAWIAALLAVFTQAFAFLYVGKVRLFWIYFAIGILANIIDKFNGSYVVLTLVLVCPIHAYILAKNYVASSERKWYTRWWCIPVTFSTVFVSFFLTRSFLYEPFHIPSMSMHPSLKVGDNILVKKLGFGNYGTYGFTFWNPGLSNNTEIKRGAIYVFYPPNKTTPFVMRVIGMPGDIIEIKSGFVYINGAQLPIKAIADDNGGTRYEERSQGSLYQILRKPELAINDLPKTTILINTYFLLGDNRDNSFDSRFWGTVDSKHFVGEVLYIW